MNELLNPPAQDRGLQVPVCQNVDDLQALTGTELYVSPWVEVDQNRIDLFAEATGDFQWVHVNPARAAQESGFGGTIAHGFLTLSLLGKHYEDFMPSLLPFCDLGINYGLNRVRFMQPVRAGSRLRSTARKGAMPIPPASHSWGPSPAAARKSPKGPSRRRVTPGVRP